MSDLEKILKTLAVPQADPAIRERTLYRAGIALSHGGDGAPTPAERPWRRWALLAGGAFAAAILVFAFARAGRPGELEGGRLLAEMERLFPGQLEGVITSGDQVTLDLASAPSAPRAPSQRLALTFQRGRQIVRVLGYSGRKICVKLDGKPRCLEALATGDGKVVVEGDDFLWTDAQPAKVAGYRLEARLLSL